MAIKITLLKGLFQHLLIISLVVLLPACAHYGDLGYSATANPFEVLDQASEQAQKDQRLVLVIGGGDWCRWCYVLDDFFEGNARIKQALDQEFVIAKIYFGDKKDNSDFFDQLPTAPAYPYFWILSADKQLLGVQDAFVFERNASYDEARFMTFIQQWAAYRQDA